MCESGQASGGVGVYVRRGLKQHSPAERDDGESAALEISRFGASGGSGGGITSEKGAMSHDMMPRCRVEIKLTKKRVKQQQDTPTFSASGHTVSDIRSDTWLCMRSNGDRSTVSQRWQVRIFPDLPLRSAPKDMNEYDSSVNYTQHFLISDVIVRLDGVL